MIHVADWYVLFVFACSMLGLLVSGVLFFANKNGSFQAKLLASFLISLSLVGINNALMATNFYLRLPHLWRAISPVSFLIAPLSLLYVRSVLQQEYRLHRTDLWFFVPAVLYLFTMLPFYLLPAEEKHALMLRMVSNSSLIGKEPENIIPFGIPSLLRTLYGIGTTFAMAAMLYGWKKKYAPGRKLSGDNAAQFQWLVIFTVIIGILFLLGTIIIIAHIMDLIQLWELIALLISVCILFICTSLLARPGILYGMKGWFQQLGADAPMNEAEARIAHANPDDNKDDTMAPSRKTTLTPQQGLHIRKRLEACLQQQKPFLQPNFKLVQLSTETGVPTYLLSTFINQEYGKNFSELINEYRVDYLYQLLKSNGQQYEQYTLEAMGKMAGFNSRNAFIAAVKRKTGMTPSEYYAFRETA
jgi:AraC-like DNA-binding protein